jgi:hypothetical protein
MEMFQDIQMARMDLVITSLIINAGRVLNTLFGEDKNL